MKIVIIFWSLCFFFFKPFWISIEHNKEFLENVQAALFHKTKVNDDLYHDAFMGELSLHIWLILLLMPSF